MRARISILGSDILCEGLEPGPRSDARIPLSTETLATFADWAERYQKAARSGDSASLLEIGGQMFAWLDEGGWASRWASGTGDRVLEIAVGTAESGEAGALLDLPWEVLARGGDFLAGDPAQLFVVFRSLGRGPNAVPAEPAYRDLALVFMAASPQDQVVLDYEGEESAILEAVARLPVQVVVEESGCAEFLKDRLAQEGPFEVVHVSCHGNVFENLGPILALETPEGDLDPATPGDFAAILGERKVPLAFLSACRTADSGAEKGIEAAEPFARALVRAGVPNVLGWGGFVDDRDATQFARIFYGELAEHATVPFAAATARREVLRAHQNDPKTGYDWHLARAYAGPAGAGACCARAKEKRRLRKEAGFKEFLDKANHRVRVATAREFVGRRRQAQAILRAFRDGKAGVLVFGMGNLGKSSLAARIANRMPGRETVVAFERYDPLAIFDQLVAALPGSERAEWERTWHAPIAEDGTRLADALEEMLEGPFDQRPILLVIDDLEQILEAPRPDQAITPVEDAPGAPDAWRDAMRAVLRAFDAADTDSRLLVTSRYDFTLSDGRGHDLADILERVQLRPMEGNEPAKQWGAAKRVSGPEDVAPSDRERVLVARAQTLASGNPGLQEILCRPILAGELAAAEKAIDAVEHWKTSGEVPKEENAAQEFFRRVSFEAYRNALTPSQFLQLRAATLFSESLPVPVAALAAVGQGAGVDDPHTSLIRLIGLGLVDRWGDIDGVEHAAANPLARPLITEELTQEEESRLAAAAMTPLAEAWRDKEGNFPFDWRGVEAARLALIGDATAEILDAAAGAAGAFLFQRRHDAKAALTILEPALAAIEQMGEFPRPGTVLLASHCAERIGRTGLQIALLERGLTLQSDDKVTLAQIAATHAEATVVRDGAERSLETLRQAAALFAEAGDVRSKAVAMGKVADILQQRGDVDEALRIWEEQLPVYERLGDVRERAVAMGRIADILQQRGDVDEALDLGGAAARLRAAGGRAVEGRGDGQGRRHPAAAGRC